MKLLYDEASLGEMETFSELAEALGEFDSECFIAPQSGEGWTEAVLNQVPRLFSIARSEENVSPFNLHFLFTEFEIFSCLYHGCNIDRAGRLYLRNGRCICGFPYFMLQLL